MHTRRHRDLHVEGHEDDHHHLDSGGVLLPEVARAIAQVEVHIRHASAEGVAHAFRGFRAGGGTIYGTAVSEVFRQHKPAADEDPIFLFVGDQQEYGDFAEAVLYLFVGPNLFSVFL